MQNITTATVVQPSSHTCAVSIAQLSDLHLAGDIGSDHSYLKFLACLELALTHTPDLLLLTGDLVNDGRTAGYDWLFNTLKLTGLPYVCLAGNHDVTHELNTHLPFDARTHLPIIADARLSHNTRLLLGTWQLLTLDSSVAGHIHGHLNDATLMWLHHTLSQYTTPSIIALHHQPLPVNSAWIDAYQLDNAHAFWQILAQHAHAQLVLCGHVHQVHTLHHQHTTLLTAPAVSRQFLPLAHAFQTDALTAGLRLLTLKPNGDWHSQVLRLAQ